MLGDVGLATDRQGRAHGNPGENCTQKTFGGTLHHEAPIRGKQKSHGGLRAFMSMVHGKAAPWGKGIRNCLCRGQATRVEAK